IVEVSNKKELINFLEMTLKNYHNRVVILDYTLFDFYDIGEVLILKERFQNVHWLLFSDEIGETLIKRLVAENNFSLVLKNCSIEEIDKALFSALSKEQFICLQVKTFLELSLHAKEVKEKVILTPVEIEILKLIGQGKTVKEIAEIRHSSIHTITTHKKNIFRKLEINTVYEAVKYALRAGLADVADYSI
ncbi:MAG: response regulator transcription factor, partial [Odoribacter sp.]|nr:response regulator transcription factor [Odoribacter sp.]